MLLWCDLITWSSIACYVCRMQKMKAGVITIRLCEGDIFDEIEREEIDFERAEGPCIASLA